MLDTCLMVHGSWLQARGLLQVKKGDRGSCPMVWGEFELHDSELSFPLFYCGFQPLFKTIEAYCIAHLARCDKETMSYIGRFLPNIFSSSRLFPKAVFKRCHLKMGWMELHPVQKS